MMTETPVVTLAPDRVVIAAHLSHITKRWPELHEPVCMEVVFLSADNVAQVKQVAHFPATPEGIAEATDLVVGMNKHGVNAYAVVNPLDATKTYSPRERAKSEDIVASFFHWADADDAKAAENIKSFVGPKCTFYALTGSEPSPRPHVYWELEEPTRNLKAWTETQRAIARTLKSDPAVIDPPRIMRIAGTVNWPKPDKQKRGYKPEVVQLRIYDHDERPRVESERMARAFSATPGDDSKSFQIEPHTEGERRTAEHFTELLRRAQTDGEKHGGVRDLAASLAGQGVNRALAEAIIRNACPIWDANVEALIRSAYEKFSRDAPIRTDFDAPPAGASQAGEVKTWQVQRADAFTADFVAPEYILDGVIQRGRVYTLTAPTGSGKTAVMLYASTAIATGTDFCARQVEHGDVLFLAGENPDDVRARVIATMEFYNIDPSSCRLHFIAGTFSIRADMERLKAEAEKLPNLILVIVDTFAAYFDGDDENSNTQALDFARLMRKIAAFKSKPAVIMPAHPVKGATRQNLSPKGGSSLLNEVDGNLTLWNENRVLSLHWQGKFRGPDFEAIQLELHRTETEKIVDSNGVIIPTILARPLPEIRAVELVKEAMTLEDKLLLNIADDPSLSLRQRSGALGVSSKTMVIRAVQRLTEQKLIRKFRTNLELTKDGERAVEMLSQGQKFAQETQI